MRTCQTAANEFLRQFWSAIYPQQSDFPTLGGAAASANASARAVKAAKMAGYLEKTPEKIKAIVSMAEHAGVDRSKVEMVSANTSLSVSTARAILLSLQAMKPVSDAVEKALQFYATRKPAR
jgi:transcription initiation factor TFIIH subunit 1